MPEHGKTKHSLGRMMSKWRYALSDDTINDSTIVSSGSGDRSDRRGHGPGSIRT